MHTAFRGAAACGAWRYGTVVMVRPDRKVAEIRSLEDTGSPTEPRRGQLLRRDAAARPRRSAPPRPRQSTQAFDDAASAAPTTDTAARPPRTTTPEGEP